MKTSLEISKLALALLKAQREITFAAKDATNPHFKNTYANLESVIDAVKPALNANGIVFIQSFSPSESGKLNLTTRLMHESGEWLEDELTMPLQKADAQGYGSAATYSRRYALAAITGLYQADDDGTEAVKPQPEIKFSQSQFVDMQTQITDAENVEEIAKLLKVSVKANATEEQLAKLRAVATARKLQLTPREAA
jgi:hypothetical protein